MTSIILSFGGQGRPLHSSFVYIFGFIGGQIGSIASLYYISFFLLLLNSILLFLWFNRIAGVTFAVFGALTFVLFPADTTQIYLTHSFGLQPSMSFFLLASLAYFAHRRWLAYSLILGSLITYETLFTVFLMVPLLQHPWNRNLFKEWTIHLGVMFSMSLAIVCLRISVGEGRVLELGPTDLILIPLLHMLQGPMVSMGTFLYRPVQVLTSLNFELGCILFLSVASFFWHFRTMVPNKTFEISPLWNLILGTQSWANMDRPLQTPHRTVHFWVANACACVSLHINASRIRSQWPALPCSFCRGLRGGIPVCMDGLRHYFDGAGF